MSVHPPTARSLRRWLPVLLCVALGFPASAQEAEDDDIPGIDSIIVTITKRDRSLQEVAGTISAFDTEMIRQTNIERIADAVALIPNVQIQGGRNQSISIRGISQSIVSSSPVARHVNGVFKFDNEAYVGHFYDLEAIEVARGPAGTVYGRNATAGAIDVRWKQPHDGFEAFGDMTVANLGRWHFRGGVNIPVFGEGDQRLMARFAIQREVHDGWVDNDLTTRRDDPDRGDDLFVRGSIKSVLGENVTLVVRGYRHVRDDGTISSTPVLDQYTTGLLSLPAPLGNFTTDPFNGYAQFQQEALVDPLLMPVTLIHQGMNGFATPEEALQDWLVNGFVGVPAFGIPPVPGFFRSANAFDSALPVQSSERETRSSAHLLGEGEFRTWGFDGQLDVAIPDVGFLGDLELVVVAGYERLERNQLSDLDATELFVLDVSNQYGQHLNSIDVRLQSANDSVFEWTIGFFRFSRVRDNLLDTVVSFLTPPSTSTVREGGFAPYFSFEVRPVETFELFGGVRWNRDHFSIDRLDPATSVQPLDLALRGKDVFRETTGELGIRWFYAEDQMFYAKVARGYKAGFLELDINAAIATQNAQFENSVDPEIVDALEVGLRTEWLDGRLTANLTGFYYLYEDLQVTQVTGAQVFTDNAGEATNAGVELELVYAPTPEWLLMLSVGWLDATFDEFCADDPFQFFAASEPGCPAPVANINMGLNLSGKSNLEGNRLQDSPEWDVAFVTRYEIDLGDWGTLTPVLEFQYTDDYFARAFNLDIDRIDSRTKTDLRLIWESPEQRYSVELFVENLEDETVYGQRIIGSEFMGGWPVAVGTFAPRVYGVRVGFHWGER